MTQNFSSRKEAEAALVRRAADDPAFRADLLKDPRKTIESVAGVQFLRDVKLTVLEESPRQMYLVIPPPTSGELNDADLDAVTGGTSGPAAPYNKSGVPGPVNTGDPLNQANQAGNQTNTTSR